MTLFVRAALAIGLVVGAISAQGTASAEPKVTEMALDNGMQIVVIEDHRAPVVTHMVWYRVGAADEPWGKSGIAHFFEHLMFKGTEAVPDDQFSDIIAANGGQHNAFTSQDYTAYFQRVAKDRLGLVMGLEADRMVNLTLTEEDVLTERDVVLEERSQRTDNNPGSRFREMLDAAMYMNHPYGIPVIGWRSEIETLDMADALEFYRVHYAPDNAILIVAGDVTPEDVLALAEEHYGGIPAAGIPARARPTEPPHIAARRLKMADPQVGQPYIVRRYLVPSVRTAETLAEAAALYVLSEILGSGVNSRFATALELEQRIAIGTGSWYWATARDATEFGVYAIPAPGVSLDQAEAGLDGEIARLIAEGVTDEELARVKRVILADEIFSQDDQSGLARKYGVWLTIGMTVADVQAWPEAVASVTAEDVVRVAQKHLVIERSVTGHLLSAESQ